MQQDTLQIDRNSFLCQQFGHEGEQIIGYCLYEACKDSFSFCVICLTNDDENLHEGHKNYCKGFKLIIKLFNQKIQSLNCSNEDFQALRFLFIQIQGLKEKNFTYRSQGAEKKLSKIIMKLNSINHQLQQQKFIIQNWLECMQRKDYGQINIFILEIKKMHCQKSSDLLFKTIYILLEKSFEVQKNKLEFKNLQIKIEKAAQSFLLKGNFLKKQGQFFQAINQFNKAIIRNPLLFNAYLSKGIFQQQIFGDTLEDLSNYEDAIKCYDEAIRLNPYNSLTFNNKGSSLHSLCKYEEAIRCYDEAIRLNPNFSEAYNNKGFSLRSLYKYEDAIKCYDEAIRLSPKYAKAYNNKGFSLHCLCKYEEAIKCYDAAIRLSPKYAKAYNNKGFSLHSLCKYQEAIKSYETAIKLNPKLAQIINDNICQQFI